MFFCSALSNFGVENILQRFLEIAPAPGPLPTLDGEVPPNAPFFSGFVYKVAANMDKMHRDRIAFVRVCSGRFERGMVVTHARTGKPFSTKYAHSRVHCTTARTFTPRGAQTRRTRLHKPTRISSPHVNTMPARTPAVAKARKRPPFSTSPARQAWSGY